jgi:tRNA(His) 5'-end guanylyltransferase
MRETTAALVDKTHATIGYTQSDEISLLFYADKPDSSIFFEGKIQKMCSVLAGLTSTLFMRNLMSTKFGEEYLDRLPHFDCRVFTLPNKAEAANAFLWREQDATKNAISMAAQHYYSHKKLQGINSSGKQELLWQKGVNFNDYPDFFKRGTFFRRVSEEQELAQEIWDKIPEKKRPESRTFVRSRVKALDMPPFNTVANRVEVLFEGHEPITKLKEAVQLSRKMIK